MFTIEALSCFILKAREVGHKSGFKVGEREEERMEVLHILVAEDTLLFCEATVEHLRCWKWMLICFEHVSCTKINLQKGE